jgi:DNA invertase Pin-like site-specific DNA recombinase
MIAAIYSRKSKFTGKGESIENQIQLCKEYAASQLRNTNITEFLIYEDEGFSGGNTNRPEFQKLMEDAKLKKFDVLICYRLDRISRNVSDFSTTLENLQKYDIDFISIREQFDTSTPMGRAMIYIASVFAQLERETIAERIRDNMLELSKTGRWLGGTVPIGYNADPITYLDADMNERKMVKLKQVPKELNIVKLLYSKYLELKSLSKVETYALQNSLKTKRGSDFTKNNIRIILTNPVYVKATEDVFDYLESQDITTCGAPDGEHGLLSYNKQKSVSTDNGKIKRVFRDKSEWIAAISSQKGVIDADDWLEVQKTLTENKDSFPNEGKTHNALLTGKIRCAKCGSNMQISHGHISKKTGKKIYYYACALKKHSKGMRCNNKNAKVAELDPVVINNLKELAANKEGLLNKLKMQNKKARELSNSSNREEILNNSIADKNKQIQNLMNKLAVADDISDLLIDKIRALKNGIKELKIQLSNLNKMNSEFSDTELNLSFIELMLNKCSMIDSLPHEEIQQLVEVLIDKITWDGESYEVTIDFIGSNPEEDEDSKKK